MNPSTAKSLVQVDLPYEASLDRYDLGGTDFQISNLVDRARPTQNSFLILDANFIVEDDTQPLVPSNNQLKSAHCDLLYLYIRTEVTPRATS